MSGTDHGLALRGGVIAQLLATAPVAAIYGEAIYGQDVPADHPWPFARVEIQEGIPEEDSCSIGETRTFRVNVFHQGVDAEALAFKGCKAVTKCLDETNPVLELEEDEEGPTPVVTELFATRKNVLRDTDTPDAYHGFVDFSATTAEDA